MNDMNTDKIDNVSIEQDSSDMEMLHNVHQESMGQELPREKKAFKILMEIAFYIVVIYVSAVIIPEYVIQRTLVDGPSMENTLLDEDNLLVEKFVYKLTGIKRFDIIVLYPFGREYEEDYYVKRVIGMPGETIQIVDNVIYVDGEVLDEDYGLTDTTESGIAAEPIVLAEDEYFVLGDNRDVSSDSRDSVVGPVKEENIGGRVVLRIYPFDRFGTVK